SYSGLPALQLTVTPCRGSLQVTAVAGASPGGGPGSPAFSGATSPNPRPKRKVVPMSLLQLLVLAVAAMIGLGALRLTRARLGRTPLPDGRGGLLFFLAFLAFPPMSPP